MGLLGRALLRHDGVSLDSGTHPALLCCYVGLAATLVKAFAAAWLAQFEARAASRVAAAFRHRAAERLLSAGASAGAPRVFAALTVRTRELEAATIGGAFGSVKAVAQLVPLACALIYVSGLPAIGGSLLLLPFAVLLSIMRRRWRSISERAQRAAEQLHTEVDDLVRYLDLWRSYGAGEQVQATLRRTSERAGASQARVDALRAAISGGNEVLGALGLLGALTLSAVFPTIAESGGLVMAAAILLMAYRPLRDLGDARSWALRGTQALTALRELLQRDLSSTVAVAPTSLERVISASSVAITSRRAVRSPRERAVRERTEARELQSQALDEHAALEVRRFGAAGGVLGDFRLEAGACLCVVGATGSGKTTLLRCLLGLEPTQGELIYGGVFRQGLPSGPRFRPFAWVPQDAPIVTGTVLENVRLFGGSATAALDALRFVGAGALVERCDEVVGPGGTSLSGGECRQVTLARAVCSGLPVLLLDEPSSGLDDVAAERLVRALTELRGIRTLVVVTHDRRLLSCADLLLEL